MELRQLEYFRVIAETESIHEAARRLNMSQPPLSYQLKQLEAELNVTLFERTRQGVRLTEAGKLLYDRSANLLEYVKSTELEVAKVGKKRVLQGTGCRRSDSGINETTHNARWNWFLPGICRYNRKRGNKNDRYYHSGHWRPDGSRPLRDDCKPE